MHTCTRTFTEALNANNNIFKCNYLTNMHEYIQRKMTENTLDEDEPLKAQTKTNALLQLASAYGADSDSDSDDNSHMEENKNNDDNNVNDDSDSGGDGKEYSEEKECDDDLQVEAKDCDDCKDDDQSDGTADTLR